MNGRRRGAGIIPARAGFTCRGPPGRPGSGDHPRSRGVYWVIKEFVKTGAGIIPARAGFTRGTCSTGVREHGSSPLARGLPRAEPRTVNAGRIIPARAGFTDPRRDRWGWSRDHPRSRGVYMPRAARATRVRGSSPLARGLLGHQGVRQDRGRDHPRSRGVYARDMLHRRPRARIIPARAGFTPRRAENRERGPDHPRSRGVYRSPA